MKLIVTGGGTGGHIYPALEVAKYAREQGHEVAYWGSFRGQEGKASEAAGFPFMGFASEPLYSLKTVRGLKAALALWKARGQAKKALASYAPDVVFSTGGYSAGPVVAAAEKLGIPYVIHSADSVPPRSNRMFADKAHAFTTLFKSSERYVPDIKCVRVGQPIRKELREAVSRRAPEPGLVLCIGGSQGSEFLNGCVPSAFKLEQLAEMRLLIASGPNNYERTQKRVEELRLGDSVTVKPYLQTEEMMDAYCRATLVVGRSGGTLAELAMFGIPSVLVPLPTSASNHQLHNAEEFVEMNAATLLPQDDDRPVSMIKSMADAIAGWMHDLERREKAAQALKDWDLPDATERIYGFLVEAAK